MANLSQEIIAAARTYTGQKVVAHQDFAGNCYEQPGEFCFSSGLGPDLFDCSGLMLRVICDVSGSDIDQLAAQYRHVRDIWQAAVAGQGPFQQTDELMPGNLLVISRTYDIHGKQRVVPGHMGIVTETGPLPEDLPRFIHTSAKSGVVTERQLRTLNTTLGDIAIRLV